MEKSHVSMEQHVCPICGKVYDSGAILLDRHLRKSMEMHTVTGYHRCEDCKKMDKDGFVALVEVSNSGSDKTLKIENAQRTGQILWLKKSAADQLFNVPVTTPMLFIDKEAAIKIREMVE